MNLHYDHIISRFSVRRYEQKNLDPDLLKTIKKEISNVQDLDPHSRFFCEIFNYDKHSKEAGALGPFGHIFSPPNFLAPFINGDSSALLDLGFRTQQLVVDMWARGIGSCYIGCNHQQRRVIELLNLPDSSRIVSMVAFGIAAEDQSKYFYQKVSQAFTRSKSRMDYDELFIDNSYTLFKDQPDYVKKIIEAGRQAPSATNAQPWRFKISQDYFHIFAKRKNAGRIFDPEQEYCLHDTGICMANMTMAAKSLGKEIHWELLPLGEQDLVNHLIPAARFTIDQLKGE